MTDVATEVWRRRDRRGRELDELCVFERDDAVSSGSWEGSAFADVMMAAMRGSRILSPEEGGAASVFETDAGGAGAFGVTSFATAAGACFSFFGGSGTTGVMGL